MVVVVVVVIVVAAVNLFAAEWLASERQMQMMRRREALPYPDSARSSSFMVVLVGLRASGRQQVVDAEVGRATTD